MLTYVGVAGGEIDVRGSYTAMAAAHMLNLDKVALAEKAGMVQYVKRCQVLRLRPHTRSASLHLTLLQLAVLQAFLCRLLLLFHDCTHECSYTVPHLACSPLIHLPYLYM